MGLTPSNMLPLGTTAPDFCLLDVVDNKTKSLAQLQSNVATVIMFICNHCPYVVHIKEHLTQLANDYVNAGVNFIAINSNDAETYPDDSPEKMRADAKHYVYPFPYLYDETQQTAHAYQAACTPDFYVFDHNMQCAYRGQLDNSRPGSDIPITGNDLRHAIDCVITKQPVPETQHPSMGCNIKWKHETA